MSLTDDLYAAVYATPFDDAPRSVLADHLQELGDPRGELIALQLARADADPPSDRETELLDAHRRAWLGRLAKFLRVARWRGGFIEHATAELLDGTPADPMWNTVRTLSLVDSRHHGMPAVLGAGCFRGLRDLATIDLDGVSAILDGIAPPLVELGLDARKIVPTDRGVVPARIGLYDRLVELLDLDHIWLRLAPRPWTAAQLEWIFGSPITRRASRLTLSMLPPLDVTGCLRAAPHLASLTFLIPDGGRLCFTRGGALEVSGSFAAIAAIAAAVAELPVDLLVSCDAPSAWAPAQRVALDIALSRQQRLVRA